MRNAINHSHKRDTNFQIRDTLSEISPTTSILDGRGGYLQDSAHHEIKYRYDRVILSWLGAAQLPNYHPFYRLLRRFTDGRGTNGAQVPSLSKLPSPSSLRQGWGRLPSIFSARRPARKRGSRPTQGRHTAYAAIILGSHEAVPQYAWMRQQYQTAPGGCLARINVDDDVEGKEEFWALLPLVNNDRDAALGKLVRFFRLAQKAYGDERGLTIEQIEAKGLGCMIASGWAVVSDDGLYRAKGADDHFAWYRQKLEAAKAGGEAKAAKYGHGKQKGGASVPPAQNRVPDACRDVPSGCRDVPDACPLAPAPALAPVLKKEEAEKSSLTAAILESCCKTWEGTLFHFGIHKKTWSPKEREMIARAIQAHGAEYVDQALYGYRFRERFEKFDPKKNVSLANCLERDRDGVLRIDKFVNLAALNLPTTRTVYNPESKQYEPEAKC